MSVEDFETRMQLAEQAERLRAKKLAKMAAQNEGGRSGDFDDQGQRLDPPDPSHRPPPEGLFIRVGDSISEIFDPAWQDPGWGKRERAFNLFPSLNGENCGILSASFVVAVDDETNDTYRYVRLGDLSVHNYTSRGNRPRNLGIGSALLQTLEEYAKDFGASRIEGAALPADQNTPNLQLFYQRRGYTVTPDHDGYSFVKQLTPGHKA